MKSLTLSIFLVIAVIIVIIPWSGCASWHRHFSPVVPSKQYIACKRYHYCSVNAGAVIVGSTVCYTDNIFTTNPIDNKDLKCE